MIMSVSRGNGGLSGEIVTGLILCWRQLKPNKLTTSSLGGIVAGILSFALPVEALQVVVTPTNPQLGDTLSVIIQVDGNGGETPKVSLQQKNYPAFPIGNGRLRALLAAEPPGEPRPP